MIRIYAHLAIVSALLISVAGAIVTFTYFIFEVRLELYRLMVLLRHKCILERSSRRVYHISHERQSSHEVDICKL